MNFFFSDTLSSNSLPVIYNSELLATATDGSSVCADVYYTRDSFDDLCSEYLDEYDHIELSSTVAVTDAKSVDYVLCKYGQTLG